MCGVLAIIGQDLPATAAAGTALDLMRHRGPDGRGIWRDDRAVLGCRRLAILDRSAAGDQPMVDATTGVALVFNGEIYNDLELRDRLVGLGHCFRSGCDTEVLLRAYLEWGSGCVDRFNGMWAFVIWDPRTGTAFFSRDRLGVKPFYYAHREGRLAIASEPKALRSLYPELRRVDERTLCQFLAEAHSYHGDRSFYAGIRMLEPGRVGTFEPGQSAPRLVRYWDFPSASDRLANSAAGLDRFSELLEDAISTPPPCSTPPSAAHRRAARSGRTRPCTEAGRGTMPSTSAIGRDWPRRPIPRSTSSRSRPPKTIGPRKSAASSGTWTAPAASRPRTRPGASCGPPARRGFRCCWKARAGTRSWAATPTTWHRPSWTAWNWPPGGPPSRTFDD